MTGERERIEVSPGAYHDSVTLLQVSRVVGDVEGVTAAQVAMATDLNVDVMRRTGFAVPADAGPNDLVVAVRAVHDDALAAAEVALGQALAGGGAGGAGAVGLGGTAFHPRTTGAAARASGAGLALVSVPGQHAFPEAMDALEAGLDVLVFSDNVPVDQEVRLKQEARRRGLLVMGPDYPGTDLVVLAEEAAARGEGIVLLLDVVLGHAVAPDPARELPPALEAAAALADVAIVVSLCGTEGDPQNLDGQAERLRAAGASVHLSNAAAARKALELINQNGVRDDVRRTGT
ncbi:MAG: hypothetical protein ACXV3A_06600 [Kineosporiaceae bacterium]